MCVCVCVCVKTLIYLYSGNKIPHIALHNDQRVLYNLPDKTNNQCKKNRTVICDQLLDMLEIFTVKNKKNIFLNLIC